ncbi:hypothetical protein ACLOJK_018712 [Asimina triloba]
MDQHGLGRVEAKSTTSKVVSLSRSINDASHCYHEPQCSLTVSQRELPARGDGSGENLVVKRARVGVVPGWVTDRKVLSATPLGSIEARGNDGRRPMGVGPVGLPLCRNKSVRAGWADVGGAEAWASYQSIGTQSGQYLSSDPGWWDLIKKGAFFVRPKPIGRLPPLPRAYMLPNSVAERTSRSITHPGTTPTRARLTTKFSPLPSPLKS